MAHLYVFSVAGESVLKIGRSNDPTRRLKDIQSGQWYYLDCVAVFPNCGNYEGLVLAELARFKTDSPGTEWVRASVNQVLSAIGLAFEKNPNVPRCATEPPAINECPKRRRTTVVGPGESVGQIKPCDSDMRFGERDEVCRDENGHIALGYRCIFLKFLRTEVIFVCDGVNATCAHDVREAFKARCDEELSMDALVRLFALWGMIEKEVDCGKKKYVYFGCKTEQICWVVLPCYRSVDSQLD